MPNIKQEKRIISEWIAIQRNLGVEIQDPEWRDRPNNGDIEATAFPFAIEHTSVDSIEKQRLYEAQFNKVFEDLRHMTILPPARLKFTISLDDFAGIDKAKLKSAIVLWVETVAPKLPDGHSRGSQIIDLNVGWRCWKYSNRPPGLYFGLAVDAEKSRNKIASLISKKDRKLETYRRQGLTSVVIVESEDLQLMAPEIFLEMILEANEDKRFSIEQLWFVDTSIDEFEFWKIDFVSENLIGPFTIRGESAV